MAVGLGALAGADLVHAKAAEREVLEHGRALRHVGQHVGPAHEVLGLAARALDQALGREVVRAAVVAAHGRGGLGGGAGERARQRGRDLAAGGVALGLVVLLRRRGCRCAQAADRDHRAHGHHVVDRVLFLADADRPDAVAHLDVALRGRAQARLGLFLGVAGEIDALRVLGREGVVVLAAVVDRDQRRDVGVAFGGLDPVPAGGALEQVRLRLRRALAGRARRQVGRRSDHHGWPAVGAYRDAGGVHALAAHVARRFTAAHLEITAAGLELEVAQERLVVLVGRIEEALRGRHDRAGRALGDATRGGGGGFDGNAGHAFVKVAGEGGEIVRYRAPILIGALLQDEALDQAQRIRVVGHEGDLGIG